MNFHDRAFEKAYLQIIKESADVEADVEVCPDCGGTGVLEDGTPCACVSAEVEQEDEDEVEECGDQCEECGDEVEECDGTDCEQEIDEEDCEGDECEEDIDEEDADEEEAPAEDTDDAAAEADDAAAEPAEGGKFISFFTTDENLIKALQDGFAKIAVTGTDEKAEPVEFEADLFENLSVEDLKDDEEGEAPAEDTDATEQEEPAEDDQKAAKAPAKK